MGSTHASTPLRVLHLISGDLWAGAEAQVLAMLTAMKEQGLSETACIVFNPGLLVDRLNAAGVRTVVLDETRLGTTRLVHQARAIASVFRPDVIHAHRYKEHFVAATLARSSHPRTPLVRTVHGLSEVDPRLPLSRRWRSQAAIALERFLMNHFTDVLIAVSRDLGARLKTTYPRTRVVQISNGLDLARYAGIVRHDAAVRTRYGIGTRFWIGTAGRLVDVKNQRLLVAAARLLSARRSDFTVSIFGDGTLRRQLEHQVDEAKLRDVVRLHGFEPDVLPVLASLDVFVLCSRHEGLPISLLEAMALGTPVVVTAVGGMTEAVRTGETGIAVPAGDADALANALGQLLDDPRCRGRLAEGAQAALRLRFSSEAAAHKQASVYAELVRR